jgi:predicted MFS family arabinose efflux permease
MLPGSYRRLLAQPDVREAFAVSLLARLPIGMGGLALLLLIQLNEDSYASAGFVTSAYIAGLAGAAPVLGRLIDRLGPDAILAACAALYPIALIGVVVTATRELPLAWTVAFAACAGASLPPVTVCQRALLRQRFEHDALLVVALSLDSVLIELVFILGPLLVALLVAWASPSAAVLAAAAFGLVGSLLFLRTRALSRWVRVAHPAGSVLGPLAEKGFPALLGIGAAYAVVFGLVEIGLTAFAAEAGRPALAGVLLGVMSLGSAAGGLAYGSRHWHMPLATQCAIWLALLAATLAPLAALTRPWAFAAACAVAGLAMAPPLIIQSTLVAKMVSARYATEGFTWSMTALLCGVGAGLAAGGLLLETGSVARLFGVAAVIALATAALALKALRQQGERKQR